jgi:ABC-2 type transport system ATP-binding protein
LIIQTRNLGFSYGDRKALDRVDLEVPEGKIFGLLGPNGGGKTTLFRILSTLVRPMEGSASVLGYDLAKEPAKVRAGMGVVFQSPSIDKKLSVRENAIHQGHLYGLHGASLCRSVNELLEQFQLADRAKDRVETLSGGLARRVEIVKALLHRPKLLLMDEPSTGLDPRARMDLFNLLLDLRDRLGISVVLTTHIMDEADRCDRIAILNRGKVAAVGTPGELKKGIEGDVIGLQVERPDDMAREIDRKFGTKVQVVNGGIRIEHKQGHRLVADLMEAFPDRITEMSLRKPTLEDVFLGKTGEAYVRD